MNEAHGGCQRLYWNPLGPVTSDPQPAPKWCSERGALSFPVLILFQVLPQPFSSPHPNSGSPPRTNRNAFPSVVSILKDKATPWGSKLYCVKT